MDCQLSLVNTCLWSDKPGCTTTEDSQRFELSDLESTTTEDSQRFELSDLESTTTEDSQRFELSDLESKGVAKTAAQISYALTAQLMCSLYFAYAKSRFSYDAAQMKTLFVLNDKMD